MGETRKGKVNMKTKLLPDENHLATLKCKTCGSTKMNLSEQDFANGGKHIKANCSSCNRYIAFVRQLNPNTEPGDFIFPFGKHEGESISVIFEKDPSYLFWASENLKGNIKDRCKAFLDSIDSGSPDDQEQDFRLY